MPNCLALLVIFNSQKKLSDKKKLENSVVSALKLLTWATIILCTTFGIDKAADGVRLRI